MLCLRRRASEALALQVPSPSASSASLKQRLCRSAGASQPSGGQHKHAGADCELPHAAPWSVCASFPSSTSFALEMPPEDSPAWPFMLQGTSVTDGSQAPPPLLRRSQRHLCALPRSVPLHPPAADRAHAPSCPREPRRDVIKYLDFRTAGVVRGSCGLVPLVVYSFT